MQHVHAKYCLRTNKREQSNDFSLCFLLPDFTEFHSASPQCFSLWDMPDLNPYHPYASVSLCVTNELPAYRIYTSCVPLLLNTIFLARTNKTAARFTKLVVKKKSEDIIMYVAQKFLFLSSSVVLTEKMCSVCAKWKNK